VFNYLKGKDYNYMEKNHELNICLTEREKLILSFLINGFSNREIAQKISVSKNTIKLHISSILKKTNSINRASAIYKLTKANYI